MIRSDDYQHTQREVFLPENQAENKRKNEILNSDRTDQNKSFGSKTLDKAMDIRLQSFITF